MILVRAHYFVGRWSQKVENLKEKQRESEKQLSNLFNSLMQRAFRGEL